MALCLKVFAIPMQANGCCSQLKEIAEAEVGGRDGKMPLLFIEFCILKTFVKGRLAENESGSVHSILPPAKFPKSSDIFRSTSCPVMCHMNLSVLFPSFSWQGTPSFLGLPASFKVQTLAHSIGQNTTSFIYSATKLFSCSKSRRLRSGRQSLHG